MTFVSLSGAGCTVIGTLAGLKAGRVLSGDDVANATGTAVKVKMSDGRSVKGELVSVNDYLDEAYFSEYSDAKKELRLSSDIPDVNERLTVVLYPEQASYDITFRGFGGPGSNYMLAIRSDGSEWTIPFERLSRTIDSQGQEIQASRYKVLASKNRLPKCTRIVLKTYSRLQLLDAQKVKSISTQSSSKKWVPLGFTVGLALDVAAYLILRDLAADINYVEW